MKEIGEPQATCCLIKDGSKGVRFMKFSIKGYITKFTNTYIAPIFSEFRKKDVELNRCAVAFLQASFNSLLGIMTSNERKERIKCLL